VRRLPKPHDIALLLREMRDARENRPD
jgi:hypothetical protein